MATTAIAADINESLDVHLNVATEITFDDDGMVDDITKFDNLVLREVLRAGIGVDTGLREDFLRSFETDPDSILLSRGKSTPAIRAISFYTSSAD